MYLSIFDGFSWTSVGAWTKQYMPKLRSIFNIDADYSADTDYNRSDYEYGRLIGTALPPSIHLSIHISTHPCIQHSIHPSTHPRTIPSNPSMDPYIHPVCIRSLRQS